VTFWHSTPTPHKHLPIKPSQKIPKAALTVSVIPPTTIRALNAIIEFLSPSIFSDKREPAVKQSKMFKNPSKAKKRLYWMLVAWYLASISSYTGAGV
jgi:hypothetical protein